MREVYYLLRDPGPDVTDGGGGTVCSGQPQMPASWTCHEIHRGSIVLYHVEAAGRVLHVYRLNAHPSRTEALYAVAGEQSDLDTLAAHVSDAVPMARARTVWQAATSGNATARLLLRAHPHWRITGTVRVGTTDEGDPIPRDVTDRAWPLIRTEGVLLPDPATDPLPWLLDRDGTAVQADAWARVTALHYPALLHDVAGWGDYQTFEGAG